MQPRYPGLLIVVFAAGVDCYGATALLGQELPSHIQLSHSAPQTELPYDARLVSRLVVESQQQGDAVSGARIFASAQLACLSCHRVGARGGSVGPDLSTLAERRNLRHIVESVLWPAREIEPEFALWRILTTDGKVLSGYRQKANERQITLRDPGTGQIHVIAVADIEQQLSGGTPMPDGLTATLSPKRQADLIRFLSHLGRGGQAIPAEVDAALTNPHSHGPANFPLDPRPIDPLRWPNAGHPVNDARIYDFYTKQAEYFRQRDVVPMLLAPFPGLDGGRAGHWGNQTEQQWADDRWNDTKLGSVQCGILRVDGMTVPRGVCVRLGDHGELSACFDPDTLGYPAVWGDGFVSFSSVRHGFLGGLQIEGRLLPTGDSGVPDRPFTYHGFYRNGDRTVFAYRIGDQDYLDAPWVENGRFVRHLAPADQHPLRRVLRGGPTQWPEIVETRISPGSGRPYSVDTIGLPYQNPWKALLFCGGHDFLPDGSAMVCTIQGDVWHVTGLDGPADQPGTARWRRFASGLHHALGLVVADGAVYVQCRDQLTRLTDLNADGEADFYQCFSNAFETSPAGHDFICGLQRDRQGNFYTASGNQGLLRIASDGRSATVVATGIRNPDGLALLPDGTATLPASEGEWTPASMICAVRDAAQHSMEIGEPPAPTLHFGYRGPRQGKPPELPLAYLPRGLDNSSGGQAYVDSDRWGPLQRQLLHLSFGMGSWFVVLRDEVDGQLQGAVVPMAGDFLSGVHRGRFHPVDGQLYVTGMNGWVSFTPDDGCFQRVRYTGDAVQLPVGFHIHQNGIRVTFSQALEKSVAEDPGSHFAQAWNYRYSGAYGSAEFSPGHPGVPGHDPVAIASAHCLPDGRSLFLAMPELQPVSQLHLRLHVNAVDAYAACGPTADGHDLFITVHKLDRPFTDWPGYSARDKTVAAHPLLTDMALNASAEQNPWKKPIAGARRIEIRTGENLTFTTREFQVRPGEAIALTLANPDVVPHNWVLVRPAALQRVGEAANRLISDPHAFARQYVPQSDDVLSYTDIVSPGDSQTVFFRAPAAPGHYPFLCTFPGHWMVMNGTMVVQ